MRHFTVGTVTAATVTLATTIALAILAIAPVGQAQTSNSSSTPTQPSTQSGTPIVVTVNPDLNRAKNLARQTIERANGGLGRYQAERAMHGPATDAPYVDNGDGSWTFTFVGGAPGYTTPTVESVVTVYREGWRVAIDYNGALRSSQ